MAVKLRLARWGAKKRPYYRVVVADVKARRDGRYIEHVGSYDPTKDPEAVTLDWERINYWLGVGATPTLTVKDILKRNPVAAQ